MYRRNNSTEIKNQNVKRDMTLSSVRNESSVASRFVHLRTFIFLFALLQNPGVIEDVLKVKTMVDNYVIS